MALFSRRTRLLGDGRHVRRRRCEQRRGGDVVGMSSEPAKHARRRGKGGHASIEGYNGRGSTRSVSSEKAGAVWYPGSHSFGRTQQRSASPSPREDAMLRCSRKVSRWRSPIGRRDGFWRQGCEGPAKLGGLWTSDSSYMTSSLVYVILHHLFVYCVPSIAWPVAVRRRVCSRDDDGRITCCTGIRNHISSHHVGAMHMPEERR